METTVETPNPAVEADVLNRTAWLAVANLRSAAETLEREADAIEKVYGDHDAVRHFADAAIIRQIIDDWQGGAFQGDYPGDLPFIASIRGNLEI